MTNTEIKDPEITIPRRHLGQCQENRHKSTKGKKDRKKEGKSKKAHLSYSILLVPHHVLRAAFRLALGYRHLPSNISSTPYNNPHFHTLSDC